MIFRKIGVLKIWKNSFNIFVNSTKWTLYIISKSFAYVLMNLLWFSIFFGTPPYRKYPAVIPDCEIKKIFFLSSWNLSFYFFIQGWPICSFLERDGGRQEKERKASQKNKMRYILSVSYIFSGKFPVI